MKTYKKREIEPLQVEYSSLSTAQGYELTRRATKRYEYFGLSYEQAMMLSATKIAKYTRDYSVLMTVGDTREVVVVPNLTSEIAVELEEGNKYRVSIAVNETDEKLAETIDFARTFADENARDYDEGTDQEYFEITRAVYYTSGRYFEIIIRNTGEKRAFQIEWKESPTATSWHTLEHTHAFSGIYQQYYFSNMPRVGAIVRLVSGEFVDDGVIVEAA